MLSAPGVEGRRLELSGEAVLEPRRSALKEKRFRTLLGRLELLESGDGEGLEAYAVVMN